MPYFIYSLDAGFFFNTIRVSNSLDQDQEDQDLRRQQKSPLAGKEINTKQLVDTTFWLKPWLELISFGSNFFHLAKVLATTNSERG